MVQNTMRLALLAPVLIAAYWLAWELRDDFELSTFDRAMFWSSLPWILAVKLVFAGAFHRRHEWMRYVSFRDLVTLAGVTFGASVAVYLTDRTILPKFGVVDRVPRSVLILDFVMSLLLIGGLRSLWRFRKEHVGPLFSRFFQRGLVVHPVLLVGANRTSVALATQIQFHPRLSYHIAGFLDDDDSLHDSVFGGVLVRGGLKDAAEVARRTGAKEVFVLDNSLPGPTLRELLNRCSDAGVKVRILSSVYDLLSTEPGKSKLSMREVDINDLLRRDPIALDDAALAELLAGRVVLVTGAGGSIGSEICRQIVRFRPRKLVLVERAENNLFQIERELLALRSGVEILPCIADVTDERRMRQVFDSCRPEVLFHAAAHKHVPMMERNPGEAIYNNVFGTRLTADLADEFGLRTFVLISTDKAVRPTSVMGLTKQIAERYVHSLSQTSRTRFVVVRFGNVLGSAGSVVPIFKSQIARGGPVTVTHPEMRRYFMTIPEASQLVLQAGAMGRGGEIFVLDMGEQVKIVELARDLIRLSGFTEEEIRIEFTGIRPGEKLYEELYFDDEQTLPTTHPKLRVAYFRPGSTTEIDSLLKRLEPLTCDPSVDDVQRGLRAIFPEFGVIDVVATAESEPEEAAAVAIVPFPVARKA